jgi:hypothetical protein
MFAHGPSYGRLSQDKTVSSLHPPANQTPIDNLGLIFYWLSGDFLRETLDLRLHKACTIIGLKYEDLSGKEGLNF